MHSCHTRSRRNAAGSMKSAGVRRSCQPIVTDLGRTRNVRSLARKLGRELAAHLARRATGVELAAQRALDALRSGHHHAQAEREAGALFSDCDAAPEHGRLVADPIETGAAAALTDARRDDPVATPTDLDAALVGRSCKADRLTRTGDGRGLVDDVPTTFPGRIPVGSRIGGSALGSSLGAASSSPGPSLGTPPLPSPRVMVPGSRRSTSKVQSTSTPFGRSSSRWLDGLDLVSVLCCRRRGDG